MKTYARAGAAALIVVGLITGCERSTTGTVAQSTQPGPPLATATSTPSAAPPGLPSLPGIPIPNPIPIPDHTNIPEVPAPPNAQTMLCAEYSGLDEATRLAVVRAILAEKGDVFGPSGEGLNMLMADTTCRFLPEATVADMLATRHQG